MKIIKILSEIGTMDIRIEESENKYLDIVFGGTGDIYWIFDNQEVAYLKEDPMYDTLIIPKTDYDIYKIFEEAYDHLVDGGNLWIVIRKNHGAQSAKKFIEGIFGNCEIIRKDKGYYILKSQKK